jgi:hypothetical protein
MIYLVVVVVVVVVVSSSKKNYDYSLSLLYIFSMLKHELIKQQ